MFCKLLEKNNEMRWQNMYDVAICDDEKRDRESLIKDICDNKEFEHMLRIHE